MSYHTVKSADEISFQGIPYGYLDQTGHLPIWRVIQIFGGGEEMLTLSKQSPSDGREYEVSVHHLYRLSKDIHNDINLYAKMIPNVVCSYARFREVSYVTYSRLTNGMTGKFYGEAFCKSVKVNIKTMTPIPIPTRMIEMLKDQHAFDIKVPDAIDARDFPEMPPPTHRFQVQNKVLYSDLDDYNHTNHTCYTKFCMDCASSAALKGFYKHFTGDMCWYPVEEVDIQYIGDSKVNDELVVNTWQNENNIRNIFFIITLRGEAICKASLLFYLEKSDRALKGRM